MDTLTAVAIGMCAAPVLVVLWAAVQGRLAAMRVRRGPPLTEQEKRELLQAHIEEHRKHWKDGAP